MIQKIMSEEFKRFVNEHADDDVMQLLMQAARYGAIDVKAAARQIEARQKIRDKAPSWYACEGLFYPSKTAVEQCSSETTALYKQRLIGDNDCLCDLTGGLGVDTYFFSQKARYVHYVEADEFYCEVARHNFCALGVTNINVTRGDAIEILRSDNERLADVSVFYLDPARRSADGKRRYALQDCSPDLTVVWPLLRERNSRIIAKLSPMMDVSMALRQLPDVRRIDIVSVKNDCKELLATGCGVAGNHAQQSELPEIFCVNYTSSGEEQLFAFTLAEERAARINPAEKIGKYLYEPNVSILKAGACKTVALRYGVEKLHHDSHLYTSDRCVNTFPGRVFDVTDVIPFGSRTAKNLCDAISQANITVRNFPISADELRRRARIADGGDVYLFATTLFDGRKVIIRGVKSRFK